MSVAHFIRQFGSTETLTTVKRFKGIDYDIPKRRLIVFSKRIEESLDGSIHLDHVLG
jgi:hypothetical protein